MSMQSKINAISICVQTGTPVFLQGEPGVAKTAFSHNLGEALEYHVEPVILSTYESTEIGGWPYPDKDKGVMCRYPPEWAKRATKYSPTIVVFDEFPWANASQQSAALRVVQEGRVGEHVLTGISFILIGNPPEEGGGGHDLIPPMANRVCHISWLVDADMQEIYLSHLRGKDKTFKYPLLPKDWRKQLPYYYGMLAAYLDHRREYMQQLPSKRAAKSNPWPSLRTNKEMAKVFGAADYAGLGEDTKMDLVCGMVGEGAGGEFLQWWNNLDLPDVEKWLKKPSSVDVEDLRSDQVCAALTNLIHLVNNGKGPDGKNLDKAWKVIANVADQQAPDIAVNFASSLMDLHPSDYEAPYEQISRFAPILKEAGLL